MPADCESAWRQPALRDETGKNPPALAVGSVKKPPSNPPLRDQPFKGPAKHLPNMAMILNEFGLFSATQNQMEEVPEHVDEALKIERQPAEQNPAVYLPDMA
jgi:hypothetical protein